MTPINPLRALYFQFEFTWQSLWLARSLKVIVMTYKASHHYPAWISDQVAPDIAKTSKQITSIQSIDCFSDALTFKKLCSGVGKAN